MYLGEPRATAYLARNIIREGKELLPTEILWGLEEFSRLVLDEHENAACLMLYEIFSEQSLPTAARSRNKKVLPEELVHAFTAFKVILTGTKWAPAERLRQKLVWFLMSY